MAIQCTLFHHCLLNFYEGVCYFCEVSLKALICMELQLGYAKGTNHTRVKCSLYADDSEMKTNEHERFSLSGKEPFQRSGPQGLMNG